MISRKRKSKRKKSCCAALAKIIRRERLAHEVRQVDIAHALGIEQSSVVRLESGVRRICVQEFLKLADVIGFDRHAVLDELSR